MPGSGSDAGVEDPLFEQFLNILVKLHLLPPLEIFHLGLLDLHLLGLLLCFEVQVYLLLIVLGPIVKVLQWVVEGVGVDADDGVLGYYLSLHQLVVRGVVEDTDDLGFPGYLLALPAKVSVGESHGPLLDVPPSPPH